MPMCLGMYVRTYSYVVSDASKCIVKDRPTATTVFWNCCRRFSAHFLFTYFRKRSGFNLSTTYSYPVDVLFGIMPLHVFIWSSSKKAYHALCILQTFVWAFNFYAFQFSSAAKVHVLLFMLQELKLVLQQQQQQQVKQKQQQQRTFAKFNWDFTKSGGGGGGCHYERKKKSYLSKFHQP